MSEKQTKAAIFCETQCSDGDGDEDYIDLLIKKRGAQALNTMLREDSQQEQDAEQNEIVDLRDSLIPPPAILQNSSQQFNQQAQIVQKVVQSNMLDEITSNDDSKTSKGMLGYHKRRGTVVNEKNALPQPNKFNNSNSGSRLLSQSNTNYFSSSQLIHNQLAPPFFNKISNDTTEASCGLGLEQQDTIVRQVSYETVTNGFTTKDYTENTDIAASTDMFNKALSSAIDYFSKKQLPEIKAPSASVIVEQQQSSKALENIQKQILQENEALKIEINKLLQKQYQLRGKNKEYVKLLSKQQQQSRDQQKQQQQQQLTSYDSQMYQEQIGQLQHQLQQMTVMYEKEKMDKEHTAIAYKRFLQRIEIERQQAQQLPQTHQTQLGSSLNQFTGSFLSQSSNGTGQGQNKVRITGRSPSPMRSSTQTDQSLTHQQVIQQLQEELAKKDKQIGYYKQGHIQQHNPVHSEENILDEFDEEDQRIYNLYSHNNSQSDLTPYKANNLQNQLPQNAHKHQNNMGATNHSQFYSYEKTSQSPLGMQNTQNYCPPSNSTAFTTNYFRERTHSPSPINTNTIYKNQYVQNLGGQQQQLTSSSCSSSSHISQQQQQYKQYSNQQITDKSFIQAHHARIRKQSPSSATPNQMNQKCALGQSSLFQGNNHIQGVVKQKRLQTEIPPNLTSIQGVTQLNKKKSSSRPQYLLTNSSGGSSGMGMAGHYPLMSGPGMSSNGCRSDEEDEDL